MIIAFYIPEELAGSYHKERFQPTLARLKRYARQAGTPTDLKIIHQLEASFCVSREIVKGNGGVPLVGPGFGEAYCQLKAKLENVQATAYTESVDAGMKNRKLKRALWMARAKAYRYIAELITCFNPDYVRNRKMFTPNNQKQKQMNSLEWARLMLKVESKCRAKAEEYK